MDDGGGFADVDVNGRTEISLEQRADGKIQLSIETTHMNRIAIGAPLDSAAARDLGEQLIAHSVLLESPEDD